MPTIPQALLIMTALDEVSHALQAPDFLEHLDVEQLRVITTAHNYVDTAREVLAQTFGEGR
jgi:hypothetical protein